MAKSAGPAAPLTSGFCAFLAHESLAMHAIIFSLRLWALCEPCRCERLRQAKGSRTDSQCENQLTLEGIDLDYLACLTEFNSRGVLRPSRHTSGTARCPDALLRRYINRCEASRRSLVLVSASL